MITQDRQIIVIPDIHGRGFWRKALSYLQEGHLVFLGDYLDPYETNEGLSNEDAFFNLLDIVEVKRENPDRVSLLWGNHDLHYMYKSLKGSRYDYSNAVRFNQYFWQNQDLFQYAEDAMVGSKRFLFTHAGVGKQWAAKVSEVFEFNAPRASELNALAHSHYFIDTLGAISGMRGGWSDYGSMVWADCHEQYNKENQYESIVQVFGHTQRRAPLNIDNRIYCLDCHRCFIVDSICGLVQSLDDGIVVKPTE